MEIFRLEATSRTPEVELNPEQGTLTMIGESYPEDIRTYYEPITVALEQFAATQPSDLKITIKLTYFNSGSARALMELLDAIDEAAQGVSTPNSIGTVIPMTTLLRNLLRTSRPISAP